MSITEVLIKLGGGLIFIVGLLLVLGAVGFTLLGAISFINPLWSIIVGILLIWLGIIIVRDGTPTA